MTPIDLSSPSILKIAELLWWEQEQRVLVCWFFRTEVIGTAGNRVRVEGSNESDLVDLS